MGKYAIDEKELRTYNSIDSCIFKKNIDEFGGFSNMATIYPLQVNGIVIRTSEALYQLCRFPHHPEIQQKIIDDKSPMTVKMTSKYNTKKSREDWESVRVSVMKWCLQVKLAQNFITFGNLFEKSTSKNIVENSAKDNFWGAIPNADETIFIGKNALGRLLMELRAKYFSVDKYALLYVNPPKITDFLLLGQPISIVDERQTFMSILNTYWEKNPDMQQNEITRPSNTNVLSAPNTIIPEILLEKNTTPKISKQRKNKISHQPSIFG